MSRPRVLLAEDHPGMAAELRRLLDPDFDVVGVVGDGQALLREAGATRPDVIVSDVVMPKLDGIVATQALRRQQPGARVVLVTVHEDAELVERGYAAGALGYVLKLRAPRDLVPAIRAALRGERYAPTEGRGPGDEAPTRADPPDAPTTPSPEGPR